MNTSEILMIINVVLTSFSIVFIPMLNIFCGSHLFKDLKRSQCCAHSVFEYDKAAEERKLLKTTSDLILNKK